MNKIKQELALILLVLFLLPSTAMADHSQLNKNIISRLPITSINYAGEAGAVEQSNSSHNLNYNTYLNNPKISLEGKTPKFYRSTKKETSIQTAELNINYITEGFSDQLDPVKLYWGYSLEGSGYVKGLAGPDTRWNMTQLEVDGDILTGLETPENNGLSIFSPDDNMGKIYLVFNGEIANLEAGVYDLKLALPETYLGVNASTHFIIEESPVDTVRIAGVEDESSNRPVMVNLSKNQNYQLKYSIPSNVEPSSVKYSLAPVTSQNRPTSDYATINSQTGLVNFTKSLPEDDTISADIEVDGIKAEEPIVMATEGGVDLPGIKGIKPVVSTVFVNSADTYKPINNIVTEPFEKPVEGKISFNSSSFQITSSGTGTKFEIKAPSNSFKGNTIITATYTDSSNEEYVTTFSVEFIGNKDVAVSGIGVMPQLSFSLTDTSTQNVNAVLLPEDVTDYDHDINYLELFKFSSSDQKVAYVDSYGNVTPIGVGTCKITTSYTDGSTTYKKETSVTVVDKNVGSITLSPLLLNLNLANRKTGTITATVFPEDIGLTPTWSISNNLVAEIEPDGLNAYITAKSVGTATVTATCLGQKVTATVQVTQEEIYPESMSVYPNAVYLATQGTLDATVFNVVTASLFPGNATTDITWSSDTDIFDFKPSANGQTVSVVPKDKPGFGFLTATATGSNGKTISAVVPVTISNKPVVIDAYRSYIQGNIITADSPDSFKVNVYAIPNPAMRAYDGKNVRQVTMFCWSNLGQTDINCKVANFEGNGLFSYTFPVNRNEPNNYFERACNIRIGLYGSFEEQNGNLMTTLNYNYVQPNDWTSNVAVTPYCQNIGFKTPTVGENEVAGTEGQNLQLEGIRIATPIEGLGLVYNVHVQDFGWIEEVSSGTYCGTMNLNKQLEAIQIKLTGDQAANYSVRYQVHAESIGWMDWVSDGQLAGSVGENRQIEAVRIMIVPRS